MAQLTPKTGCHISLATLQQSCCFEQDGECYCTMMYTALRHSHHTLAHLHT